MDAQKPISKKGVSGVPMRHGVARPMQTNAHDALFKAAFSQVEHAAGELRQALPPELVVADQLRGSAAVSWQLRG
ncbi:MULTISPECIES: hypothetical protein [Sorangium]|uniref:hypothetical protein n=1 Tax=Sorangium TaxID=39643 RepID=UPI002D1E4905|nr:hypothetical protein [Sorangium sp. Soce836]